MTGKYEQGKHDEGFSLVLGCDEVGRGCLAGPVVAAAVAFAPASLKSKVESYQEIKDSKLLTSKKREELSEVIKQNCVAWGIGLVEPNIIDEINIHHATLLAMRKAVESLLEKVSCGSRSAFLYLDGKFLIPKFDMKQEAVVGGDNKILSVAAASIVAKVYRDDLMRKLHIQYPCYNFAQHKGYGTLHHRQQILKNGLSAIHRKSFCKGIPQHFPKSRS